MAQFIKVASTADLAPGEAKCVEVAGKKIALFNLEGSFYAIDDTCTHRGGPLCEGEVAGEEVTCPGTGRSTTSRPAPCWVRRRRAAYSRTRCAYRDPMSRFRCRYAVGAYRRRFRPRGPR